ncbi:hypothetical protein [Microbispora sp. H11081]|nr:hypothetical protein [Microbispora sp. H11081]
MIARSATRPAVRREPPSAAPPHPVRLALPDPDVPRRRLDRLTVAVTR